MQDVASRPVGEGEVRKQTVLPLGVGELWKEGTAIECGPCAGSCGGGCRRQAGTGPCLPGSRSLPAWWAPRSSRARAWAALTARVGSRSRRLLFLFSRPKRLSLFLTVFSVSLREISIVTAHTVGVWGSQVPSHTELDEMPPSPRAPVIGQCQEEPTDSRRHTGRTMAPSRFHGQLATGGPASEACQDGASKAARPWAQLRDTPCPDSWRLRFVEH